MSCTELARDQRRGNLDHTNLQSEMESDKRNLPER